MNKSIQYDFQVFLRELLTESADLQAMFPDNEVVCGTANFDSVPNLFIQYDVVEYPIEFVGRGQFGYNIALDIDIISPYEEKAHLTARIISGLFPTGYNAPRRVYTSTIDSVRYSIGPLTLESTRNYPRTVQNLISYTVSHKYSTEVYEVI